MKELISIFVTFFIVIDPLGILPIYLSLTRTLNKEEKKKAVFKSIMTAFFVFAIFILAGKPILDFLGIHPGSFFIAGGILLFLVAMDMLFGTPRRTKTSGEEHDRDDIAVFPLGIPIIAGPGTITTILLFVSETHDRIGMTITLFIIITAVLALTTFTMLLSNYFLKILGKTGVSVIERVMGIILTGLSVQFIYDGLLKLGIIT